MSPDEMRVALAEALQVAVDHLRRTTGPASAPAPVSNAADETDPFGEETDAVIRQQVRTSGPLDPELVAALQRQEARIAAHRATAVRRSELAEEHEGWKA